MDRSKIFSDVIDSAIGAKAHFDSWWALASEAKGELKDVVNQHPEYFGPVWDAHYTAFFVYFAHLFDRRADSSSLPRYLAELQREQGEAIVAPLLAELNALSDRAKPLLTARHKTIAHVDSTLTEKDVFLDINITWKEVREILADTVAFVLKLHGAAAPGEIGIPRDGRLRDATFKVLNALRHNQG